ncbi:MULTISPECIES: beta-galactosidase [unclassified Amycolatopsis]|uniref:beta-galactosidase n=1 Tax=unclassified Amycolatopsis TaxID=2618356 RepID=UPI002875C852|nr:MULTISPECIES: beta-galactosidase [unclassified Amycolatopsis]MDS0139563.1 beta-galactosidase [Amycolatopsis sp. 505]MDS0147142.1 beta-galactosidase [Amycolatopsis sp. CM201R]
MRSRRRCRTLFTVLLSALLAFAGVAVPQAAAAPPPRPTHTVTYDGYSFLVDGSRTYLWSGEFHSYRLPSPDLWLDIFQKMKAAGFNATSLYFDWGYHSPKQGVYDFSGIRDLDKLLDLAQQAGLYVIARPGPYINAEVDGGGFPTWLSTTPGHTRSADPVYLEYSDEWQTQIDRIIARHQLTTGTGSVLAYQVENEYYNGNADGRAYMQHLEDKARADGITVPLVGNNNGTFNAGAAALDVDAADSYPQGFDCSNPTRWNGVPDISYDHVPGKPLITAEFQGGAFDPWGGPGYEKCAQLINDQFADVFYKQNIAVGATGQSFYMLHGGTSWGWSAIPQNYTSYDYGAAITEGRQFDPKYAEDKLIGYFTQSVAPLTKTDGLAGAPLTDPALTDTARINPDTRTQFHTLRHSDSTSTATNTTSVALDLAAHAGYTYDDRATEVGYTGTWSHVGPEVDYTGGDYQHTESFSNVTGDSVSIPFTGTGIRWVTSKDPSHGVADVYLDDTKVSSVDLYAAGKQNQVTGYEVRDLPAGAHTLKIAVTGQKNAKATAPYVVVDAVDLLSGSTDYYPVVPQQPGTGITLNGRQSKILVAGYDLGATRMQYSTSEILTSAAIGNRDVAVLYGDLGGPGETVLRFAKQPAVQVLGGAATSTWDAARGDLRLNYTHDGLTRVLVTAPGARPLLLLLADKATAATFWRQDTASGPVLVRGTHLVRTTAGQYGTLSLTGDTGADGAFEVFGTAKAVLWNGSRVPVKPTSSGSLSGTAPAAKAVTLPALTGWKHQQESPESQPAFDDSAWPVADKETSNSSTALGTKPVLFADDYGFHTGNTWYRGHFTGDGKQTGITLSSQSGGPAGAFSAWLNGAFLGSSTSPQHTFTFPAGSLRQGDNEISVLTVNMGHEEDYGASNGNKAARGLTAARLTGTPLTSVTWRLQGVRGGETGLDPVRGPLNTGGLYGERAGWSLPGFPDRGWAPASLPAQDTTPGVSWYRTAADLDLPRGQDTSLGLTITDDPARQYRALLFVNGWQLGQYVNYLGPQHSFPIPTGILNPNGRNTIAVAVWNLDGSTGGLGTIAWTNYGSYRSPLTVRQNASPGYDPARYAMPPAPTAGVSLTAPDTASGGQAFTASATVRVPAGAPPAFDVKPALTAPAGWTVGAASPPSVPRIDSGKSATFTWAVTPPSTVDTAALKVAVAYRQAGRAGSVTGERIVGAVPPAPPAGQVAVGSLPFLTATNGWGPVERDTSNGEASAGDGKPMTIGGVAYGKGLGAHAASDVQLYLAGACTRLTASVGVDGETGTGGSVSFSVSADGVTKVTTPVVRGGQAAVPVDVDVTGAQVLDLVVSDGGDGNGQDHADWAVPTLTCGTPPSR